MIAIGHLLSGSSLLTGTKEHGRIENNSKANLFVTKINITVSTYLYNVLLTKYRLLNLLRKVINASDTLNNIITFLWPDG